MTKKLTFTIQCGENTCEGEDDVCGYWTENLEDLPGCYCTIFRQGLKSKGKKTLRCKECKESTDGNG